MTFKGERLSSASLSRRPASHPTGGAAVSGGSSTGGGGFVSTGSSSSKRNSDSRSDGPGGEAGKESGGVAKPYSALMRSLFSPEPTPSQEDCAVAAATALCTDFQVPPAYDSMFYNQPEHGSSTLVHSWSASGADPGFQAVLVLKAKTALVPTHLGLPGAATTTTTTTTTSSASTPGSNGLLDESAYLLVSGRNQPFIPYHQATKAQTLLINVTEYLTLLSFWTQEWPRLSSKLLHQTTVMREGLDPVAMGRNLMFYGQGFSYFTTQLSSRLTLKARADSKFTGRKEDSLNAWLELTSQAPTQSRDGESGGGAAPQDRPYEIRALGLPIEALNQLCLDTLSVKAITNWFTNYKSQRRKRSQPV